MTKYLVAGLISFLVGAAGIAAFYFLFEDKINEKAPSSYAVMDLLEKANGLQNLNLNLIDMSGNRWDNEKFHNKLVILSFWATWCQPCVTEFPSMVELAKVFKDEVVLVAISNDTDVKDVKNFINAFQGNLPNIPVIMDDKKEVTTRFQVLRLPESFIFNKEGKLVKKVVGIQNWSTPEAISFFKSLIN